MHVSAAEGWLGLGNWQEAEEELKRVDPALLNHPEVLAVKMDIFSQAKNWDAAAALAEQLKKLTPDHAGIAVAHAYAVRRKTGGGIEQAREILEIAHRKFTKSATIVYNLACYECQLGNLDKARQWFQKATEIAGLQTIRGMALADKDLEPLWAEIRELI